MEKQNYYFEQIIGAGIITSETTLSKVLRGIDCSDALGIDTSKVNFAKMKEVVNYVLKGKDCPINQLYALLNSNSIHTVSRKLDAVSINGWKVFVEGKRYSNNKSQVHIYVNINGSNSLFCRYVIEHDSVYWLLDVKAFSQKLRLPYRVVNKNVSERSTAALSESFNSVTDQLVQNLKDCNKLGDASRFTDSPKQEIVEYPLEYIVYKGGLELKRYKTEKSAVRYAEKNEGDVYYTGDLPKGVKPEIAQFLSRNIRRLYEFIPF